MTKRDAESHSAVLEIRDLVVQLPRWADRENAVESVTLAVQPKEILCVVGESGSGKSVTAHAVMGLLPKRQLRPVAGEILLEGEDLLKAAPSRLRQLRGKRMSMIFQEPMTALNPVVKVGQQIEEVIRTHSSMSAADRKRRVLEVMDDVRLPEPEQLYRAFPHQLSGGQRQRVMIAAALALEPRLLIADEPTTALDVTTQAQILRIIRQIQETHDTAVLFITHDIGVVAEIADRVAVMQKGRLVELGEVEQVLHDPQDSYTKMLISAVPSLMPKAGSPKTQNPEVLSVRKLAKTYKVTNFFGRRRDIEAVRGVDLTVRRGEVLGVVGESGSGKTTVARTVVRLTDPSDGSVFLDDIDIGAAPSQVLHGCRRKMQIIFQDPYRSLNPRRTIGQSIVEGPMNYGVRADDAWCKAKQLLELVGIERSANDRYPHQFSGGQRQRICIARALAMEPELLVADEVVSALDVSVQAQVLKLLDSIRRRFDLAVLFITHDLRVAAQVCDSIAVMYRGEVVEYGPTYDVYLDPKHDYTRALLKAAPGRRWNLGANKADQKIALVGGSYLS